MKSVLVTVDFRGGFIGLDMVSFLKIFRYEHENMFICKSLLTVTNWPTVS